MRQPTLIRFCEGREALRPPCRTTHQFRTRHQYEHRQSPQPHDPTHAPRPRRRGDRMRRRAIVVGLAAAWPVRALAQQPPERARRIGVLRAGESNGDPIVEPLRGFLRQAGWEEGRNLSIIYRWAEDRDEHLKPLAEQLVAERVDVLVTTGN